MLINKSNVTFSSIVSIGQKVKKTALKEGIEFLELNRGVNAVCNIDIDAICKDIDFNSNEVQIYSPNLGLESLRRTILAEYFPAETDYNNVSITPGGMPALDIIIQTLNVENIYFPYFYWGSYSKMTTIRGKKYGFYEDLYNLDLSKLSEKDCIFICDPSNPTGIKYNDIDLVNIIQKINDTGCTIIFDSPYRKLFESLIINVHSQLAKLKNVIIAESFSKSIGLSGLRIGFIYCTNKEFNDELNIRLLYEFNSVSTISQLIVNRVLNFGKKEIYDFRKITIEHISKNIQYLKDKNLLVQDIYKSNLPIGIFAIINKTEESLFKNKIGAVSLDKFVNSDKEKWSNYSRICVSVNHDKFVKYFDTI